MWPAGLRRIRLEEVDDLDPTVARAEAWRLGQLLAKATGALARQDPAVSDENVFENG